MSYYYQRIIPNEVIHEIEKLILEGKTYREIKEIHKVSDGTITRIKQGKVKSNREIEDRIDLVPLEEVSEIQRQLQEARKALVESRRMNKLYELEIEKNKNAAKAEINIFNELNSLAFNKENYDKFMITEFGSKVINPFIEKLSKGSKLLEEEKERNSLLTSEFQTVKAHLKRIERPQNDSKSILDSFSGLSKSNAFNDDIKDFGGTLQEVDIYNNK